MTIIFLILPITLLLSAAAVAAFAWATRSGQFDDLETPAIRLLHDERARPALASEDAPKQASNQPAKRVSNQPAAAGQRFTRS